MDLPLLHLVPPDSTSENLLVYGAYEVTHMQINCSIFCFLVYLLTRGDEDYAAKIVSYNS